MGELLSKFELLYTIGKQELLDYLDFLISKRKKKKEKNEIWRGTVKPMRDQQSIEDMITAKNSKGFDNEAFDQSIKEMDVQEPIEELLKCLTP